MVCVVYICTICNKHISSVTKMNIQFIQSPSPATNIVTQSDSQIPTLHFPKPETFSRGECSQNPVWFFAIVSMQRSGSGWFTTASKNECSAAVGFKWMLNQISGEAAVVKKALHQIASRLHENPSRSQHLLASTMSHPYPAVGAMLGPAAGDPMVPIASLVGHYGGYKGDTGEWPCSLYSAPRDDRSSKEFSLRLVCPTANIGGVIGKGGAIINQFMQESGAGINIESSSSGDDCLITISAKKFFEDTFSPTIEAAVRLQPRCNEKVGRDSGILLFTTRLLVPTSRIDCLIGKGGSIVTEMRRMTKANVITSLRRHDILVFSKLESPPIYWYGRLDTVKNMSFRQLREKYIKINMVCGLRKQRWVREFGYAWGRISTPTTPVRKQYRLKTCYP